MELIGEEDEPEPHGFVDLDGYSFQQGEFKG